MIHEERIYVAQCSRRGCVRGIEQSYIGEDKKTFIVRLRQLGWMVFDDDDTCCECLWWMEATKEARKRDAKRHTG